MQKHLTKLIIAGAAVLAVLVYIASNILHSVHAPVDFDEAVRRNKMYVKQEAESKDRNQCRKLAVGQV